jgi:hypothetical protein
MIDVSLVYAIYSTLRALRRESAVIFEHACACLQNYQYNTERTVYNGCAVQYHDRGLFFSMGDCAYFFLTVDLLHTADVVVSVALF